VRTETCPLTRYPCRRPDKEAIHHRARFVTIEQSIKRDRNIRGPTNLFSEVGVTMADCISEYNFQLYIDPYDTRSAVIGDTDGTVVATVNRFATRHGDGFAVARLLRAAPAMLKALEVALDAYSPNSHLLGVECNPLQRFAASTIREAIGLALYGSPDEVHRMGDGQFGALERAPACIE
jgi:hypothetical protein